MTYITPGIYRQEGERTQSIFNKEIDNFLSRADDDAKVIQAPTTENDPNIALSNVRKIKIGNTYSGVFIGSGNVVSSGRRGDGDTALRWLVGIVFTVVCGYALWNIGRLINQRRDAQDELNQIEDFKDSLDLHKATIMRDCGGHQPNEHITKIEQVVIHKEKIFSNYKMSANISLALHVALVAGGVIAIVGAIVGSATAMGVGACIGLAAVGLMLLKWGYESSSKAQFRAAEVITEKVQELLEAQYALSYNPYQYNPNYVPISYYNNNGNNGWAPLPAQNARSAAAYVRV